MDLVKIIKTDYPNCILLGDFNTAIGIIDSAYAEYDVDVTGYLSAFRSMSDWLETLLASEECFFCFLYDLQRGRMRNDRLLSRFASNRTKRLQLLQHEAPRPREQLWDANRLHCMHAFAARLSDAVFHSLRCGGKRSLAGCCG